MPISSPYNFIPLSDTVHTPGWQEVSQDVPLADGVSGTFDIEISTKSPTIVGDEKQGDTVNFFTTPDGKLAIPGSSIKGMIRGIVETITNARLTQINDTKISYREFIPSYTQEFTATVVPKEIWKTKTHAGWLKFENEKWTLKETTLFRIENTEIRRAYRSIQNLAKEAEETYKKIQGIQEVTFNVNNITEDNSKHKQIYQEAIQLNNNNAEEQGFLIITGQAGRKKMNFIFQSPESEIDFLNDKVMVDFLSVATKEDPQNKSDIYKYLNDLNHKHGVPVFFLKDNDGKVKALGLTQIFRLMHKQSIGDLMPNSHKRTKIKLDFAELLFGDIDNNNPKKGRVNVGLSTITSIEHTTQEITKVLASPKPSFYPTYINQKEPNPVKKHNNFDTENAKISGRKQYLIHNKADNECVDKSSISSTLNTLENATFTGKVRFHNLKPVELGALIFAFTFGEDETKDSKYYHAIGMGKSYGFGKVKIKINSFQYANYLNEFYKYAFNTLKNRDTLALVKAMHRCVANDDRLKYPLLSNATGGNDFKDIKTQFQKLPEINYQEEKEQLKTIGIELTNITLPVTISPVETLIKKLGGELNKKTLTELKEHPEWYQNLSDDNKWKLAEKIMNGEYLKGSTQNNKKQRKKWRKNLPEIFPK